MIRSNRNVFIGSHVTKPIKTAIGRAVSDLKLAPSQSKFVSDAVEKALRDAGVEIIEEERDSREVPLPLEA